MIARIRSYVLNLLQPGPFRRELEEEMAFHIEQQAEDLIRSGIEPSEARRRARMAFGSTERVQSRSREARGKLHLFDEFAQNLRYALRTAARQPLFALTFILTQALCIGAGVAIFSVVDAVLWRPLPYPESGRLALVVSYTEDQGPGAPQYSLTGLGWEVVRDQAVWLDRAVYSDWPTGVNLSTNETAAYVQQQRVSAGFFSTLGVPPLLGREFDQSEDRPEGPPVVVLSHGLWQRVFGGDADIVGGTIRLKGEAHTVVGIMPEHFRSNRPTDLWTPLRPSRGGEGSGSNYSVLVRLPAGMPLEEAGARLGTLDYGWAGETGDAPRRYLGLVPMKQAQTADMRQPLLILFGAVLLMLLVGAANLAGLQLARAVARRPEIATRQAVGGGSGLILRQLLTENLVLGIMGGLAGLLVGYLSMGGMGALIRVHFDAWSLVRLDGRVVAAAIGFTLVTTILFGLAPALQARGFDLRKVLISGGGRGVVGGQGHRLRKAFLVGEVAVVTALLFAAGLLVRSYLYLDRLDPGFDSDNVMTVQLSLDDSRYDTGEELNRLIDETLTGLRGVPGVRSAAVALSLPYERALNMPFRVVGVSDPEGEYRITNLVYVSPGFFASLGIPVLNGRPFTEGDRAGTPSVVVVNRAFSLEHFGEEPAVGRQLVLGGSIEAAVVGIVGDVQQSNAGWGTSEPVWESPAVYMPVAQTEAGFLTLIHTWFAPSWIVKTTAGTAGVAEGITRAVQGVAPGLPVARMAPLREVMAEALARPRFEAAFLVLVAAFALMLATVGLYGMVANEVVERTTEMGVRMALGATPANAVRTVGLPGVRLVLLGAVAGAGISVIAAPWLAHLIWGVASHDPLTLLVVVGCLLAVAVTASFLPATRIARLEPARILREE